MDVRPDAPVSTVAGGRSVVTLSVWLHAPCLVAALLGMTPDSGVAQASGQGAAPQVRNLAGARDQPGLFTQRLVLPANFCGSVHSHNGDLHGLVLRGILRMGFADSAGRLHVREYPVGSFVVVPAGRHHVEGSPVETEIHLSGIGPLQTTVVDSAAPQRCRPGEGG